MTPDNASTQRASAGYPEPPPGYQEPPRAGSEVDTLVGSLERQRATFAWKCADLPVTSIRRSLGASAVTIAGLLKHLAYMEDLNFTRELAGGPMPAVWEGLDGDAVWASAVEDSPEILHELWDSAVERSRRAVRSALRKGDAGVTYTDAGGRTVAVRRLLVDMVEEYARHTGHADLLREDIDGRVGEDPPGPRIAYSLNPTDRD